MGKIDENFICDGYATLEELYMLYDCGYEFVVSAGKVTEIIEP